MKTNKNKTKIFVYRNKSTQLTNIRHDDRLTKQVVDFCYLKITEDGVWAMEWNPTIYRTLSIGKNEVTF